MPGIANQSPALAVDGLVVERGGRRVLSGLSFQVAPGEALLVMGPNGAGKTTLLRTLAGFIAPSAGRIELSGEDPDAPLSERAHYVGHLNGVRPSLTVEENARFWADFLEGRATGIRPALQRLGLGPLAAIPTAYLSAGQKRRLGLVRLVIADRPLWLLDEPTASLDASSTAALAAEIELHLEEGGLAVIATHAPLALARFRELKLAPARETA